MDVSLFKRLAEAHPHAVVSLRAQYRMNFDIMTVCNSMIYEHKLFCASPAVASARIYVPDLCHLPLPNVGQSSSVYSRTNNNRIDWLYTCMDPSRPVLFLDTDQLDATETQIVANTLKQDQENDNGLDVLSSNVNPLVNMHEVNIVELLVKGFQKYGCNSYSVGIISPYRDQVSAIRKSIRHTSDVDQVCPESNAGTTAVGAFERLSLDVNTIDKFQGRDNDISIISTVRSSSDSTVSISIICDNKATAHYSS